MAGHARQRGNGTWELRAYVGRHPITGRKRYATRTVAARGKREADNALAAFVASVGAGAARPSAAVTFGELVERWADTSRPGWSPSNEATVDLIVRTYLGPLLPVRIDLRVGEGATSSERPVSTRSEVPLGAAPPAAW